MVARSQDIDQSNWPAIVVNQARDVGIDEYAQIRSGLGERANDAEICFEYRIENDDQILDSIMVRQSDGSAQWFRVVVGVFVPLTAK